MQPGSGIEIEVLGIDGEAKMSRQDLDDVEPKDSRSCTPSGAVALDPLVAGLSEPETAEGVGVTPGTVKSRFAR